jgi:integrase
MNVRPTGGPSRGSQISRLRSLSAASITEHPHGYDGIARYRAYHRGQNRFPPEARLFSPHPTLALPKTQTKPVPFDRIILLWAKQTNAPKKGNQDMEAKCGRFAEWLGHDDMARVEFENCRDYRDAMIDEGDLSSGSILNHLKLSKALFTYAFDNEHITTNPMACIKYSAGDRKERDDFTPEERTLILILARNAEPHVYWVNWVCCFLGTRTSEVADASTLDIECTGGIWVMSIHRKHRSRDQRLKTKVSTRKLALHGALLDEGFLDYWRSLPLGGPLFPNVPLDTYGKRASKVTTECSIWLRNVVKITDPNKPFYSHRHTATSYLRNTRLLDGSPAVKEDIERYILGHAGKGAHAGYGKRWFETLKAAVEVIPNPLAGSVSEEAIPQ